MKFPENPGSPHSDDGPNEAGKPADPLAEAERARMEAERLAKQRETIGRIARDGAVAKEEDETAAVASIRSLESSDGGMAAGPAQAAMPEGDAPRHAQDAIPSDAPLPEEEVKVTRAVRKRAVDALGDSFAGAKEVVEKIAAAEGGGRALVLIARNSDKVRALLAGADRDAEGKELVQLVEKADGVQEKAQGIQEKAQGIQEKAQGIQEKAIERLAKNAETDKLLARLERMNPAFAQTANAEFERYAADQKAKNDALAAAGKPPVEPMGRRDYLAGAYVAGLASGLFLAGVSSDRRDEARREVEALQALSQPSVDRFLREVAPGAAKSMAANSIEASARAAGIPKMDHAGERPEREDVRPDGTVVRAYGDGTVTESKDGSTVVKGPNGRVEIRGNRVVAYGKDGSLVSNMERGRTSVVEVGQSRFPLSVAGKSPDGIRASTGEILKWERYFRGIGLGFLGARDLRAFEKASAEVPPPVRFGEPGQDPARIAARVEWLLGLRKGELLKPENGFRPLPLPVGEGGAFRDRGEWLRDRYFNGWTDRDGKRRSGPAQGGKPYLPRLEELLREEGRAGDKN